MFNVAHIHLMINHVPIIGSVILLLFYTHALIFKKENLANTSYIFYILVAALTAVVYISGEPAEIFIENRGIKESIVEPHEIFGLISLLFFILCGVLSVIALVFLKRKNIIPNWIKYGVLAVSFISVMTVVYTAQTGGEIIHSEISNQTTNILSTNELTK